MKVFLDTNSKTLDVDVIVTRDPKHYKEFDIKVQTPTEFLDDFEF